MYMRIPGDPGNSREQPQVATEEGVTSSAGVSKEFQKGPYKVAQDAQEREGCDPPSDVESDKELD
jgi:hypothetical protein